MILTVEQVHELCDYVYYGMTVKEAFELSSINFDDRPSLENWQSVERALRYAKLKAKYELMHTAHELAVSQTSINSTRMLQHLVASRCGFSENWSELKLKQRQHEDLMKFRRENMQNWSDYQAAKMIQDASGHQLAEYQQLESKSNP